MKLTAPLFLRKPAGYLFLLGMACAICLCSAAFLLYSTGLDFLPVVLLLAAIVPMVAGIRIIASLSLTWAKNEQKHLQNALTQAKDMLDTSKALRDDHLLNKTLNNNLPYPVWLKDRFGRYLLANDAFTHHWCAGNNPKSKTDADVLNESLAELFLEADQTAISQEKPHITELKLELPNQPEQWWRIERSAMRGPTGEAVGVLGFAINISAYKPQH